MSSSDQPAGASSGMKMLWAPWRLEYIKGERDPGCPFCTGPAEGPKEDNLVLWTDKDISVVMNKFPYNPGHLLIIPRAHVANPGDLEARVWVKLSEAVRACLEILKEDSQPPGFNLGMNLGSSGGAGIPQHLHWHILPRWNGDTNFMPLIAETKALPIHNATVYRRLKPLFETFSTRLSQR